MAHPSGLRQNVTMTSSQIKIPALVEPGPALTVDEVRRYSRHLIIPDVAMAGQQRLMNAKVLCVGAGGLGSPALMYLAAAGIGTLGIVEFDVVDVIAIGVLYAGSVTLGYG